MRAPAFWWRPERGLVARLLSPAGWLYGSITAARLKRPGRRIGPKVICVGNFTTGGAGKTPVAIAIAVNFAARGKKVFFISRGYGGRLKGPVLVKPVRHDALAIGDEALLLARHAPVVVGHDRAAAGVLCEQLGAEIIIMDDGLQNPSLAKDLTIAVVDGAVGVGNALPIPAGPLRAPLGVQWPFVDAVIVMGQASRTGEDVKRAALGRSIPVFDAQLTTHVRPDFLIKPVLAFAGIGRPQKFFDHLAALGAGLSGAISFGDHHVLGDDEAAKLLAAAEEKSAQLVTTEKDFVRMASLARPSPVIARLIASTAVLPVEVEIQQLEEFSLLLDRVAG